MAEFPYCKLEIFIPETHLAALQEALQKVDAGHIGKYDCCLSYSHVTGCWRPLAGTKPYLGSVGKISSEPELKVEVTVSPDPVNCVALGTAQSLSIGDKLETGFTDATPRIGRR